MNKYSKRFTAFISTKRGFIHLFLLVIIVIIAVAGIGYYAFKSGFLEKIETKPESKVSQNQSEIRGVVVSKSDVATLPNYPLGDIIVVAIQVDKYDILLKEAGIPEDRLPILSQDLIDKFVADSDVSGKDGSFLLRLPPNNYFLCIANIGRTDPVPVYINGCIETTTTQGQTVNKDIFWGEGGVTPK